MPFLLLIVNTRNTASKLVFLLVLLTLVFYTVRAQTTWKAVKSPPPSLTGIVANQAGTVIVTGESGAFISLNTGATWSPLNSFPPGRLKVSVSGDFFVFGAEVWRFNNTLQRFEQLSRGTRQTGAFVRAAGFVHDLETSTSGTMLILALHNNGVVRLPATTLATLIVSAATITTASASALTANPRTGEFFGVWDNALWSARDNGSTWQRITNASIPACSNRFVFGRTRLLQMGGAVANAPCGAVSEASSALDAMWERDDYTLFATPNGIVVERTPQASTQSTVSSGFMNIPSTLLDNTPFQTHPFGKGLRIVQFAEAGSTILAATNRGVFAAEEIRIDKANPYLVLPQKVLRWREVNNGLAGNIEELTMTQHRFIVRSHGTTWVSADSARTWNVLVSDSLQNSLRVMAHIQTPDSALIFVSTGTVQHGIVRLSLREALSGVISTQATVFTLPLGYVWLQDYRRKNVYPQNRSLQAMVRSADGALLLFARDTTVSRLAPTHVVSSRDDGRTWQREAIQDMLRGSETGGLRLENLGLGNITASPRGYLFAEDRFFQRKHIFRSGDNGKTWQILALGRVPEAFTIHPTTGTLFTAGAPMLYSTNNGDTWQASTGLPFSAGSRFDGASELAFGTRGTVTLNIRTLGQFFSQNSDVSLQQSMNTVPQGYTLKAAPNGDFYVLTPQSVMFSGDGGRSWQARTSGLSGVPNDVVLYDVVFDAASTAFLTTSRGILQWESTQRNVAVTNALDAKSMNTSSHAISATSNEQYNSIFPNPASEQAHITFKLEQSSFCTLDLINMRGERMCRLAEGVYDAGEHCVNFDVHYLLQGQYFCRIWHNQTTTTIPFSVIR